MKSILIQQVYNKNFLPLIQEQFKRNTDYCERFGLDYTFILAEIYELSTGGWDKIVHIQRHLGYDFIVWLDADAVICDLSRDLKSVPLPNDSIGAVRFLMPVPHFNVGVLYVKPGQRVNRFIEDWLNQYPGLGAWREQAAFNARKECIVELPKEWNHNYDNNPFSKPVVMGFHGFGDAQQRLFLIRKHLGVNNGGNPG